MLQRRQQPRQTSGIDYSALAIPKGGKVGRVKPGRYVNPKHIASLHDYCCCLAGLGECDGPVEVHHLLNPWVGIRGAGRRSDDRNGIPFCFGHHRGRNGVHRRGDEDAFFREKTGFPEFGRRQAEELWKNSDFWECVP
ncbi:hypothetical protein [Azospirillum himalayense]|uniref:HNH endonuclease n=1 Tax=Azospirillum himalayense TaxID=654847 RepID=A0ABW0FZC1_9PROT